MRHVPKGPKANIEHRDLPVHLRGDDLERGSKHSLEETVSCGQSLSLWRAIE